MTIILSAIIVGLGAAVLLLTAGYLFGVKRGSRLRESLRTQDLIRSQDLRNLREQVSRLRDDQEESLRTTIQQILVPLAQREKLSLDLSRLGGRSGHHGDLSALLDQIAEKGNFTAVLLSDNEGLPLAASSNARDLDRLGATSSLLLLIADRLGRDDAPAPLSLMVHDGANMVTLCRIFKVGDQRLALTAVSPGGQLTTTALDPALVKVDAALANREFKHTSDR